MEYSILGPLEVISEGAPIRLGGLRQRALLALLVLHRNEVVSTDTLIDMLWGARPPASASKTLQVYVSRLRKLLPPGRLVGRPPGYVLQVEDGELDLARFEALVRDARNAEPSSAGAQLERALGLFRGPPLADLAHLDFAQVEIDRIEELRLAAVEDRIAAELSLGEHTHVVGELKVLIAQHPLRERPHAQLMLALYRSGRHAEALETYERIRQFLANEVGIEPSERLQELEQSIRKHDPVLLATAPAAASY